MTAYHPCHNHMLHVVKCELHSKPTVTVVCDIIRLLMHNVKSKVMSEVFVNKGSHCRWVGGWVYYKDNSVLPTPPPVLPPPSAGGALRPW